MDKLCYAKRQRAPPSAYVRRRTAWGDATPSFGQALRQEIHANLKSKKWRMAQNLQGKENLEECVDAALTHVVEPALDDYVRKVYASNDASRKALEKIIGDIPEDPVTKRLDEAAKTYIEQVTEVDNALEKIRKIETDIERYSNSSDH